MQNWRLQEWESLGAAHRYGCLSSVYPIQVRNIKSHPCCVGNGRYLSPLQATASSSGSVPFYYECWLVHFASTLKYQVELFLSLVSLLSSGREWSIQFLLDVLSSSAWTHESLRGGSTLIRSVFGWFSLHLSNRPIRSVSLSDSPWFWTHFLVLWLSLLL